MVEFGEQLRRAREGKGMTQQSSCRAIIRNKAVCFQMGMW